MTLILRLSLIVVAVAVTLASALIVPLCVTWTVAAVLHAYFHVTHLDGFSTGDAVAQTTGLSAVIALPLLAIAGHELDGLKLDAGGRRRPSR